MSKQKPKRLVVHSESFHTDDVFATALLLALFPDSEVVRSRDKAVIDSGDIVYDVGNMYDPAKGRFDHHQEGAKKRPNGIKYSSFGLLWREYGLKYCDDDQDVSELVDTRLVMQIDANDNGQKITKQTYKGVEPFTIDDIVHAFNPQRWVIEAEAYDEQFKVAVDMASQVLERTKMAVQNEIRSKRYLLGLYESATDRRVLVADKQANVAGVIESCSELLYLISPRPTGNWSILAVESEPGSFTSRKPFPEAWRAQPAAVLQKLTGVNDVTFCHATGFLAVTDSKEGAKALAHKALE